MDTTNLKNGCLNKLVIYQLPGLERVLSILSAIGFLVLTGAYLFLIDLNGRDIVMAVVLFVTALCYAVFVYYSAFQNYICADFKKNSLIIHITGIPREEIDMNYVKSITCEHSAPDKEDFFIKINVGGNIKKIDTWSDWTSVRALLFNRYERQFKRLVIFCEKVNSNCSHTEG